MAARRRYTAKQKAEAVGIALVDGVTAAERQTGTPKETIQYWTTRPEFAQLRTTAREVVVDQFWIGIQIGLREVIKGIEGDAPLREKAEAMKVMADRYALLTGSATARTESRDISGSLADADLISAVREAVEITSTGGTPDEDQEPPEG